MNSSIWNAMDVAEINAIKDFNAVNAALFTSDVPEGPLWPRKRKPALAAVS